MAVKLEGSIRRYIGLSSDDKPKPGVLLDGVRLDRADLPDGSSFLESDTGRIYRWHADAWAVAPPDNDQELLLSAILLELRALRERFELATA